MRGLHLYCCIGCSGLGGSAAAATLGTHKGAYRLILQALCGLGVAQAVQALLDDPHELSPVNELSATHELAVSPAVAVAGSSILVNLSVHSQAQAPKSVQEVVRAPTNVVNCSEVELTAGDEPLRPW